MYFKKLEIFGFKSFADKTILNFEPGITAIVGPNGCGKSNVFDSIRWVLGEQSIKELRGAAKEDVIFNGTEKKPSLGFAEVSLTFSNESRMLPIEYNEVTITRRLFRSGESEYLLNKTTVRLKDIQELLMGTGIGAEAYSFIQQGKVDQVVSSKPEDRRMLLDEAAGITKYKVKKREALNKLKDTDNNLLRINDITIEVKRQIASIERQANKARRYKEKFELLKEYEIQMASFELKNFTSKKQQMNQEFKESQEKDRALSFEVNDLDALIAEESHLIEELDQKINELHAEDIKREGQLEVNKRQIDFNQERMLGLSENKEKLQEQKQQLIGRCQQQQERLQEVELLIEETSIVIRRNEELLIEKRDLLNVCDRIIAEDRNKIKDDEEKILDLSAHQSRLRNEMTDVMKEVQGSLARKRRLEMENEKVLSEKSDIDQKIGFVEGECVELQSKIGELKSVRAEKQTVLEGVCCESDLLAEEIDDLEKRKLFLMSQKEFIEKLHTQYQDIPDPVIEGRLITRMAPKDHHTGIIGKVKGLKPVEGGDFDDEQVEQLYEIICETKFIELDPQQISLKMEEISCEVEVLIEKKTILMQRIKELEADFENMDMEIIDEEKKYSILEAQKNGFLTELTKLLGELELVDSELGEVRETLGTVNKRETEVKFHLETVEKDLNWCQEDIREKRESIALKSQEKEELVIAVAQMASEVQSNQDKLISQQKNQVMFAESIDNWLEEIKGIDDDFSSFDEKRAGYELEIESLIEKMDQINTGRESNRCELSQSESSKNEIVERIDTLKARRVSIDEELDEVKTVLHSYQMTEQELSFNERGLRDRLWQSYKINLDEVLKQREEAASDSLEVESEPEAAVGNDNDNADAVAPEANQENVEADLEKPDLMSLVQKRKKSEVVKVIPFLSVEELGPEIEKLRKQCDAFGSVNLVAIEEYEELKGRFEFLTQQQSDLLEAKSQLMNTIKKINRSTRQMFMDTFTRVSEEFRIYFRMLFGGGEAQLILLDPENVLESGVDIVARPPGKKLQNISLLSGGEKSLTAIALIFGVFKVNPSPFCILDEIDAALDESNVGRFSYLLKDFAKVAQFIVITHNKKTISSANVMYGVTMPETGCSRIVSVKFEEEQKSTEAEQIPAGV